MTDGSEAGTQLIKELVSYNSDFAELNGKTLLSADHGLTGRELWMTA